MDRLEPHIDYRHERLAAEANRRRLAEIAAPTRPPRRHHMSALTLGAAVLLGGAVAATFGSSPVGVGRVADMRAAFRTPDGANDATHEPTSATPSPTPVIDPSKAPVMPALPAGPGVARPD